MITRFLDVTKNLIPQLRYNLPLFCAKPHMFIAFHFCVHNHFTGNRTGKRQNRRGESTKKNKQKTKFFFPVFQTRNRHLIKSHERIFSVLCSSVPPIEEGNFIHHHSRFPSVGFEDCVLQIFITFAIKKVKNNNP